MNANNDIKVFIDTNNLIWQKYNAGSLKKILSSDEEKETAIIKIEENFTLNPDSKINSVEIFVLDGVYTNEFGEFEAGTYLKFPKEDESFVKAKKSCTIFRKINYLYNDEKIIIDTNLASWMQGYGNLEVMPLYESTALVKWPKGGVFVPHKHWGGEF
ncbi:cupin domain-containing protein [Arcobacter vandammei]|uniref:cupin domain-containing protein n=1 Tax=Arcobacter vandammei TaxID=2782243 RepID=UPI0018DF370B|nr:cupin domain-containing protein [Arcobacter vandammei]